MQEIFTFWKCLKLIFQMFWGTPSQRRSLCNICEYISWLSAWRCLFILRYQPHSYVRVATTNNYRIHKLALCLMLPLHPQKSTTQLCLSGYNKKQKISYSNVYNHTSLKILSTSYTCTYNAIFKINLDFCLQSNHNCSLCNALSIYIAVDCLLLDQHHMQVVIISLVYFSSRKSTLIGTTVDFRMGCDCHERTSWPRCLRELKLSTKNSLTYWIACLSRYWASLFGIECN